MRLTEQVFADRLILDIENNRIRLDRLRSQVSTGKRFQVASEDPVRASRSLTYSRELAHLEQYTKNTDEALAWMQVTDAAVSNVREVIGQARLEAQQGGTDTTSPEARSAAAESVHRLSERLLEIGNSQFQGKYLFGGTKTTTPPFSGSGAYEGDSGLIRRAIAPGESVQVNLTGDQIFKTGTDLFAALATLETALRNNDTPTIQASMATLDAGLDNVLQSTAELGGDIQRTESTRSRLDDQRTAFEQLQSTNDDIDVTEAIVRLRAMENSYQASLAAGAQVFQNSLMNYLSR